MRLNFKNSIAALMAVLASVLLSATAGNAYATRGNARVTCFVNDFISCGFDSGRCGRVCEPVDGETCGIRLFSKMIPTHRSARPGERGSCDRDLNAGTTECIERRDCHPAGDPCVEGTDGIERRMCVAVGSSVNIIDRIISAASGDDCSG